MPEVRRAAIRKTTKGKSNLVNTIVNDHNKVLTSVRKNKPKGYKIYWTEFRSYKKKGRKKK
jgi:hypothetical protein